MSRARLLRWPPEPVVPTRTAWPWHTRSCFTLGRAQRDTVLVPAHASLHAFMQNSEASPAVAKETDNAGTDQTLKHSARMTKVCCPAYILHPHRNQGAQKREGPTRGPRGPGGGAPRFRRARPHGSPSGDPKSPMDGDPRTPQEGPREPPRGAQADPTRDSKRPKRCGLPPTTGQSCCIRESRPSRCRVFPTGSSRHTGAGCRLRRSLHHLSNSRARTQ